MRFAALTASAAFAIVLCLVTTGSAQAPIAEAEVFREAFAAPGSIPIYMKANAGREVRGIGRLEAAMPRAYFDSSIPDSNAAIAIIYLMPGRKITCGLLKPLDREQFGSFREGASVAFVGNLVDVQDWGDWQSVYLAACRLTFED